MRLFYLPLARKIAAFLLVLPILAFSPPATAATREILPPDGSITGPAAMLLIEQIGENLLILDVRTEAEYEEAHVPGALNIPVASLQSRMGEVLTDKPVLIICRTGRRAAAAYEILKARAPASPTAEPQKLWYLQSTPVYTRDGTFTFP